MKSRIKQDQFAADMQRARQSVGAVRHRGWAQITRIRYTNSGTTPDGLYANVDYTTTLTNGATMFEKLSFRLEDDGQWHLTGYVPRQAQNYAP
ncbi:membrane protein [Burkholderia lata]|nr:membrane protein [Burkholderia lata]